MHLEHVGDLPVKSAYLCTLSGHAPWPGVVASSFSFMACPTDLDATKFFDRVEHPQLPIVLPQLHKNGTPRLGPFDRPTHLWNGV